MDSAAPEQKEAASLAARRALLARLGNDRAELGRVAALAAEAVDEGRADSLERLRQMLRGAGVALGGDRPAVVPQQPRDPFATVPPAASTIVSDPDVTIPPTAPPAARAGTVAVSASAEGRISPESVLAQFNRERAALHVSVETQQGDQVAIIVNFDSGEEKSYGLQSTASGRSAVFIRQENMPNDALPLYLTVRIQREGVMLKPREAHVGY